MLLLSWGWTANLIDIATGNTESFHTLCCRYLHHLELLRQETRKRW